MKENDKKDRRDVKCMNSMTLQTIKLIANHLTCRAVGGMNGISISVSFSTCHVAGNNIFSIDIAEVDNKV